MFESSEEEGARGGRGRRERRPSQPTTFSNCERERHARAEHQTPVEAGDGSASRVGDLQERGRVSALERGRGREEEERGRRTL